jgi:hypothetical protein
MNSPSSTSQRPIIIPFCIFHYDDPESSTYRGIINYPTRIVSHEGIAKLECLEYGEKWKQYGMFYAFSPIIRPIPAGLKLVNAGRIERDPWTANSINYVFNPFNSKKTGVYFITWTNPVNGTVPLYLHITPSGDIYPSFDQSPPGNSAHGWKQDKMSPIYVLVDTENHTSKVGINENPLPIWPRDVNNYPLFFFKESDNKCIPNIKGVSIEKCFLFTDKNIFGKNKAFGPTPLLDRLKAAIKEQKANKGIQYFFRKIPPYTITIVVSLFILSLIACIIILSK